MIKTSLRRKATVSVPRLIHDVPGRRSLIIHVVVVLVLIATAQAYDGSIHALSHWLILFAYAACSIGLWVADRRAAREGEGREFGVASLDGNADRQWLAWAATGLKAAVAIYVVVEHIMAGADGTADAAATMSRLPAFLLLLQTGLSMRVRQAGAFALMVITAWGGTLLAAALFPWLGLLGPHVTFMSEGAGLATFIAASLVVVDGVRRLRGAVKTALRLERERSFLARFVPGSIASDVTKDGGVASATNVHACLMILDIRGFSAMTRERPQQEVVRALLDVRSIAHEEITRSGGVVDKYVGDAVLAQFLIGSPQVQASSAASAALGIHRGLDRLNGQRVEAGLPRLRIAVALHAGEVLVGVFDDGHRAEFTVLGAAMNTLARIETRTKAQNLPTAASADFAKLLEAGSGGFEVRVAGNGGQLRDAAESLYEIAAAVPVKEGAALALLPEVAA